MDDLDANSVPSPSEPPSPTYEGDTELDRMLEAEPEGVSAGVWATGAATPAAGAAAGAGAGAGAGAATEVKEQVSEVDAPPAASLEAETDAALDAAFATIREDEEEVPTLPDLTKLGKLGPKEEVEEEVNTNTSDSVKVVSSSNPPAPAPAPGPAPAAPGSASGSGFDPQAVKKPETEDGEARIFSKVEPGSEAQTGPPAEAKGDRSRSPRAERKRSEDILMNAVPRHIRRQVFDGDIGEVIEQCHKLRRETWPDPNIPGGGDNPDLLRRLPDRNALEKLSDRMLQGFIKDAQGKAGTRTTSSTDMFCAAHNLSPDVRNALLALPEVLQYRVRNAGAVVGFNKDAVVMWRINRVLQGACAETKPTRDISDFIAENWISRETMTSMQEVDPQVMEIVLSKGPLYGPSAYNLLQERIKMAEEKIAGEIEKSQKEAAKELEALAASMEAPTILPPGLRPRT